MSKPKLTIVVRRLKRLQTGVKAGPGSHQTISNGGPY